MAGTANVVGFPMFYVADMSGQQKEAERIFEIAIKAGREFVEALKNGEISQDAMNSEVPVGVSLHLGGPRTDFMIGRVFESATRDAYDKIVKEKENGVPLPVSEWINDEELQRTKASNTFMRSNCVLVR